MKVSLLNVRITIEKNTVVTDSVGNHLNEWEEYFSCAAYAAGSGYQQSEKQMAGVTVADDGLVFTVRYCSETAVLTPTGYRVRFQDAVYNITSIDMMNYGHKSIKISCEKERRE